MAYNNQQAPTVYQNKDDEGRLFWSDTEQVKIPGFLYFPGFVSKNEETEILSIIDSKSWKGGIERRTQHYGYTYYHTKHDISDLQPIEQPSETEELSVFQNILDRIIHFFPSDHPPTQCLVNEYIGNRGISSHVDNPACFGDVVVGLSLKEPVYMTFRPERDFNNEIKIYLEPRSLMVMQGEARFSWRHGITKMKRIYVPETGACVHRNDAYRRISLTFREIKIEGTKQVTKTDTIVKGTKWHDES